jgi:hypothetical protein
VYGDQRRSSDGADVADGSASDGGIRGERPPPTLRFEGESCSALPFGEWIRAVSDNGFAPYPLRGGAIEDGVYRLRSVTQYNEGMTLTNLPAYQGRILRVRGGEWEESVRLDIDEVGTGLQPSYFRFVFRMVRRRADYLQDSLVCPSRPFLYMSTYETDGSVLRVSTGNALLTYVRD